MSSSSSSLALFNKAPQQETHATGHTARHAHTHRQTHTHTHTPMHARTHARTHACMQAHMHARMHARTHDCTHARLHARTHARTHTRVQERTHARMRARKLLQDREDYTEYCPRTRLHSAQKCYFVLRANVLCFQGRVNKIEIQQSPSVTVLVITVKLWRPSGFNFPKKCDRLIFRLSWH